jgi:hypothetical protein
LFLGFVHPTVDHSCVGTRESMVLTMCQCAWAGCPCWRLRQFNYLPHATIYVHRACAHACLLRDTQSLQCSPSDAVTSPRGAVRRCHSKSEGRQVAHHSGSQLKPKSGGVQGDPVSPGKRASASGHNCKRVASAFSSGRLVRSSFLSVRLPCWIGMPATRDQFERAGTGRVSIPPHAHGPRANGSILGADCCVFYAFSHRVHTERTQVKRNTGKTIQHPVTQCGGCMQTACVHKSG